MEPRLIELEMRYTHLERQFSDLSEIVFAQQKQIDVLRQQLSAVRSQIVGLGEATPNEKPPHY